MAAAVQFGQMVERNWRFFVNSDGQSGLLPPEGHYLIDESDKQVVRENLMPCLHACSGGNIQIRKQYLRSLKVIVKYDYPHAWPQVLDTSMQYLTQQMHPDQQDEQQVITGLIGLKYLCKKYEYEMGEDQRQPLYQIFETCITNLGEVVNTVMGMGELTDNGL